MDGAALSRPRQQVFAHTVRARRLHRLHQGDCIADREDAREQAFLVRKPSHEDKRSVVLHVTAQGEKCLSQHDPINHVVNAVTALGTEECIRLRDSLREILNHLDAAHQRLDASICRDCMFLAERSPGIGPAAAKGRATAEFMCRLYRAPVSLEETELLCTSFERTRDRPKIEAHLDRARVASQG
ncbi:hypothetical protein ACVME8_009390 [Bradyrhizobium diazoefficiens]